MVSEKGREEKLSDHLFIYIIYLFIRDVATLSSFLRCQFMMLSQQLRVPPPDFEDFHIASTSHYGHVAVVALRDAASRRRFIAVGALPVPSQWMIDVQGNIGSCSIVDGCYVVKSYASTPIVLLKPYQLTTSFPSTIGSCLEGSNSNNEGGIESPLEASKVESYETTSNINTTTNHHHNNNADNNTITGPDSSSPSSSPSSMTRLPPLLSYASNPPCDKWWVQDRPSPLAALSWLQVPWLSEYEENVEYYLRSKGSEIAAIRREYAEKVEALDKQVMKMGPVEPISMTSVDPGESQQAILNTAIATVKAKAWKEEDEKREMLLCGHNMGEKKREEKRL